MPEAQAHTRKARTRRFSPDPHFVTQELDIVNVAMIYLRSTFRDDGRRSLGPVDNDPHHGTTCRRTRLCDRDGSARRPLIARLWPRRRGGAFLVAHEGAR